LYTSVLIAALLTVGPVEVLPGAQTTRSVKKTSTSSTSKKRTAPSKKRRRSSTAKSRPTWRSSQQAPTPERYKEIQQALMQRGYLSGEATGVWGAETVNAMKRFQRDQNLTETGKPSALALIALGLGPKRDPKPQNGLSRQGLPPEGAAGVQE
jgi:peptidoglycan hydrolase-like protein with peptidoglycan-binding domain